MGVSSFRMGQKIWYIFNEINGIFFNSIEFVGKINLLVDHLKILGPFLNQNQNYDFFKLD